MLERYAMKVARTVLRGGSDSNASPLPDHLTLGRFSSCNQVESTPALLSASAKGWAAWQHDRYNILDTL
jgi:hypothetical protein